LSFTDYFPAVVSTEHDAGTGYRSTIPAVTVRREDGPFILPGKGAHEVDESLYEAILGERNCIAYLAKFKYFDPQPILMQAWPV